MFQLLNNYQPDAARIEAAKVELDPRAVHLSYSERQLVEAIEKGLGDMSMRLAVLGMTNLGNVADAIDLAATIADAGQAVATFMLSRALFDPIELAHCKVAISETTEAVDLIYGAFKFGGIIPGKEAVITDFLTTAPATFVPLFEDLEAYAVKRFPHLAANQMEGGTTHV